MYRTALSAVLGATALLAGLVVAQPSTKPLPAAPTPLTPSTAAPNPAGVLITPIALGPRTWMLDGRGGNYTVISNMTVVAGDDGVVMVDSGFAPLHDKIKAAVAALADKPVRYVVNTHKHGDHSGGNELFSQDGATIVAQENAAKSIASGSTNVVNGAVTPPAPPAAVPSLTYSDRTTLSVRGRRVELIHMPSSHTNGDTAVWIPDENVLATGDIVAWGNLLPNVDNADRGSFEGLIKSVDIFLGMANEQTKIVPGHGPLMTRSDLVAYRALVADAYAAVKKAKASGLTEDGVVAAKPLAGNIQAKSNSPDWIRDYSTRSMYRSAQ